MKRILLSLAFALSCSLALAQNPFRDTTITLDQRVEAVLRQLTLDEKLQMMVHANPAIPRLGLKPYSWWNEALHGVARNGYATVYPMPIALAATFDPDLIREVYRSIGEEAHTKFIENQRDSAYGDNTGLTFFAPNINIFRDPRWGRGMETFGEDPYLTALMGEAVVKGLQGEDTTCLQAAACVKHLAVHSGPEGVRHEFDAQVSMRDLWTTYLPAFEHIIKHTDVQQVMCAYNRLNGEPCCTNEDILVDILRRQWHYDNLIVTDCWALNDCWERDTVIPRHKTHPTAARTVQSAFGSEVDLECGSGLPALRTALDSGYIAEDKIDEHVRRILRTRFRIKELTPQYMVPDTTEEPVVALDAKFVAQRSLVMLKNNGILPLSKWERFALLGPNAADSAVCVGNYNGTPWRVSTLHNAFPVEHVFDTACHLVDNGYKMRRKTMKAIESQDVIIFVGGLSPALEGEELQVDMPGFYRGDRTQIELPQVQVETIKELKRRTGKPIVLVLYTGSAIALEEVEPYVDAIIVGWYGGEAIGEALAYSLFNRSAVWGRLPVTFYRSTAQLPPFEDYSMQGRTYRYLDEQPLYPFGYGLEYHSQALNHVVLNGLTVQGEAGNATVVQVYLRNLDDPEAPRKTLVAFQPVSHGPFTITLDPSQFRQYNEAQETLAMPKEGTRFLLQVGTSSADRDLQSFELVW